MKRFIFICYLLVSCGLITGVQAQKKNLTMQEAVIGQWRQFYPETMWQLQWRAKTNEFTYQNKYDMMVSTVKGKTAVLFSTKNIAEGLKKSETGIELKYLPRVSWIDKNIIQFNAKGKLVQYDIVANKPIFIAETNSKAENKVFSNESKMFAYTLKNNLYVSNSNGAEVAVTDNDNKNIVSGQSVSRNEYGIDGGIFWSPNGENLAFYQKDESSVTSFPIVDINTRVGDLREEKYPMAGMGSEVVRLGVYNISNKKTIWIEPTDFGNNQYLTNISWDANSKYIYIQVLNRASNHMKLNKYDAITGAFVKTLLEERDNRWVEPQHKLLFLKNNPRQFVYQTNNNGHNHAYLYNTEGKLIKQLTKGNFDVTAILGFDIEERNMFYMSTAVSATDRDAYKVNMKSGKTTRITTANGTHNVKVSADGKYLLDDYSSLNVPRVINLATTKGKIIKNLLTAKNPLKNINMGEITLGTIKSADNKTDLHYRMIKPANFDPNKKYPVIVYVYGGPHAQLVLNRWLGGARLWDEYMAQQGYVMFTVDNRGSANRGKEFEAVIHRNCGQAEMADQMKGVEFLKSQPFVDANKIGVFGWSYGGFMTISLKTNYPKTFKVAVAGGPVIDWKWYEIMYGERYMDTPQENPEGYAKTSLISKAKDLKGKLLICQGAIDKTVLWQHSLNFVRECVKNNVQVDYFPYPRAEHNVHGKDRIHLMQKVTNYFDDYLK